MINYEITSHKPLREVVYEELKRKILIGEIPPGTRMMEIELSESMGVSRTPVREAIRKLEKENLVIIRPRRGAYTADFSKKEMADVLEVRQDMEGMAAALAAKKVDTEAKESLKAAVQEYYDAIDSEDIDRIINADSKFHQLVVKCSENEALVALVSQVQYMSLRFRYIYYDDFARFGNQPATHQEIAEAICQGDTKGAREKMEAHIAELKKFVVEELK